MTFSQSDLEQFYVLVGRPVGRELYSPEMVRLVVETARRDAQLAEELTKSVWSRVSRSEYLASQARECAEFAIQLLAQPPTLKCTYELRDLEGTRSSEMGEANFGKSAPIFESIAPWLAPDRTIYIRSISIHPSLRRQGFFTMFGKELSQRGITGLVLEAVVNPSWAYKLYQNSLQSDRVVLLGSPLIFDFERRLSPAPNVGLKLSD